jgi:hypothetical protein
MFAKNAVPAKKLPVRIVLSGNLKKHPFIRADLFHFLKSLRRNPL